MRRNGHSICNHSPAAKLQAVYGTCGLYDKMMESPQDDGGCDCDLRQYSLQRRPVHIG